MPPFAMRVEQLSKRYELGASVARTFRDAVLQAAHWTLPRFRRGPSRDSRTLWALRDISFDVGPGEAVGVIGSNGAGKSTLLKILSRITEPTYGWAQIKGRVASLLEIGTGFHPELTGRENIFLNGALLGMSRQEIQDQFDAIVAFAQLDRFLDTPAKHYSSGMYVRLAFAVAAHLRADVLLIDEILAVGDASFQKKCIAKMTEVIGEGRTIFFVSHNMGAIIEFCSRVLHLSEGRLIADGQPALTVESYLKLHASGSAEFIANPAALSGAGRTRIRRVSIVDARGDPCSSAEHGAPLRFIVDVCGTPGAIIVVGITIRSSLGAIAVELNSSDDRAPLSLEREGTRVVVIVDRNCLNHGEYYVSVTLWNQFHQRQDAVENCLAFSTTAHESGLSRAKGIVKVAGKWEAM